VKNSIQNYIPYTQSVAVRDWNGEFQALLQRPDSFEKFRQLANLSHDFVNVARTYLLPSAVLILPALQFAHLMLTVTAN
jgi:hypothetical protein